MTLPFLDIIGVEKARDSQALLFTAVSAMWTARQIIAKENIDSTYEGSANRFTYHLNISREELEEKRSQIIK